VSSWNVNSVTNMYVSIFKSLYLSL